MIVKLYEKNTNLKDIAKIVGVLREGGIIIYPTDTVYAFGCDAMNVRAVERICRIKGIDPQRSNLSIVCNDLSNISRYARVTSNRVFKLMKRNLPGPFTFILNAANILPKIYRHRKEVGIRIPSNPITLALVEALGNPVLSTSVHNRDDFMEYSTDPELIDEEYGDAVDIVIDGGYGGVEPSTVVDCTGDEIEIVRQGKGELIDNR
ncbi:MAG: threonylcarbamoyl-AMP synthase [Dysgonamonadaceae bacterium]|jgi:tRNA threonylcarbamoyl adenosine modification protein (Sua5/YciO/YrdC/YwlC family)|nr:threonylcarbamoyl-AMP synthase [Dysgonamonadaceae bacterium]